MISIITTTFNGKKYINQTIDSILNQSYSNFEYIIVDDASHNDTLCVIEGYSDLRIKTMYNTKNIERGASRNKGLDAAQGDYIAFCDDDDVWMPNKLEEQMNFMKNHHLDLCGSFINEIDDYGNHIGSVAYKIEDNDIKNNINITNQLCYSSVMMKKEVFDKYGGFSVDRKISGAEDYEYRMRLIKNIKVGNCPLFLTNYRVRSNNTTNTKNLSMNINVLNIIFQHGKYYHNWMFGLIVRIIAIFIPYNLRKKIAGLGS